MRIPQEFKTESRDYYISKIGEVLIAFPSDDPWLPAKQVIGTFSEDYTNERFQPECPEVSEREEL